MTLSVDKKHQSKSALFSKKTNQDDQDMVCRSFRTGYFQPLDEMPEEESNSDIDRIHASL